MMPLKKALIFLTVVDVSIEGAVSVVFLKDSITGIFLLVASPRMVVDLDFPPL